VIRTRILKRLAGMLTPVLFISSLLPFSGCGDSNSGTQNGGGLAPVSPSVTDKKVIERSKEGIMKSQAKNK
jgi:hypothetical protein